MGADMEAKNSALPFVLVRRLSRSSRRSATSMPADRTGLIHVSARFRVSCRIMNTPQMILIAGPYRSGTADDPARMAQNLARLEQAAWPIFQAGHIPMIGEWVALPVLRSAGADGPLDPLIWRVVCQVGNVGFSHLR